MDQNPFAFMEQLRHEGKKYRSSGDTQVGLGHDGGDFEGAGPITHAYKTLSVTLPANANNVEIYPFLTSIGCLAASPHSSDTEIWATRIGVDFGWCTINQPSQTYDHNGNISVSVTFDNWSDCDARRCCLVVVYND